MANAALATLLLFIAFSARSQNEWELRPNVERNNYYILQGMTAEKLLIQFYIEPTWQYCGLGRAKWDPRILQGWYRYGSQGEKISLIGSMAGEQYDYFVRLFVAANPTETALDANCLLQGYTEVFNDFTRPAFDTLCWSRLDQPTTDCIPLSVVHAFSWKTIASLTLTVNDIDKTTVNLSELVDNDFIDQISIESTSRVDSSYYVIVKYGHLSTPGYFGSGGCGAGYEEWYAQFQLNKDFEVTLLDKIQSRSCINSFDKMIVFDASHPEHGIRERIPARNNKSHD